MGISQSDEAGNAANMADDSGKSLTGLISRYLLVCAVVQYVIRVRFGVGAKRAAFYLGTEITVTTKGTFFQFEPFTNIFF